MELATIMVTKLNSHPSSWFRSHSIALLCHRDTAEGFHFHARKGTIINAGVSNEMIPLRIDFVRSTLYLALLCLARTVVPTGHDDCRGESVHQEAGDVLKPTAEGGLPSESDGEGNTHALPVHDQVQVNCVCMGLPSSNCSATYVGKKMNFS